MNTITINTALVMAIVCIVIGFVTGGIIGVSNGKRRQKKEEEANSNSPATSSVPPLVDPAKYTELLRLWRDKNSTGLYVETSGHLLASSEPLNEKQKNRFIDLIKELADWLNIPVENISEKVIKPIPAASESPVSTLPAGADAEFVNSEPKPESSPRYASESIKTAPIPPPASQFNAYDQPVIPPAAPPVPSYNPIPKPPPKPAVDPAKKVATSMVEQIDAILQEVIEKSDKPDRKIRLVEELKEGVIVWVGHEHFVGIDAVPDPIVKDLIRTAVKEWDRRTETHL
jgi:hypothetical protein